MNDMEKNEFTFSQLFGLVKKSGVRILIFCLIATIVMASVSIGVYFGARDRNNAVSTLFNFNFRGIEAGLDPLGNDFNFREIKSSHIINKAISDLNSRGIALNSGLQSKIIDNILIEGVVPDNVLDEVIYYPSSYRVTIDNIKDMGIRTSVAKQLLNQIYVVYSDYFKEIYSGITLIPATAISDDAARDKYDFLELYDLFYSEIQTAISYLSTRRTEAPSFRYSESGRSFNDIIRELSNIQSINLINFENLVVNNGISNDPVALEKNLTTKLAMLNAQLERYKKDAESIEAAISSYKSGEINIILYIDPQTGQLVKASGGNTEQLDRMHQDLIETNKKYNALNEEITLLSKRLLNFQNSATGGNSEENIALAAESADTIAKLIGAAIEEGNAAITEYYDTVYFTGAVTAPVGAVAVDGDSVSLIMLLAISAIVIILAGVAAVVTTFAVDKHKALNETDKA